MRNAGHARISWTESLGGATLAVVMLLGGAACAKPQAAAPGEVDALVASGDTVGLAHLAERQCSAQPSSARQTCYEDYFVHLAGSDRVHVALGALAALAAEHADIQREGHGYTHIIGIRAWHPGADVARDLPQLHGPVPVWLLPRRNPGVPDPGWQRRLGTGGRAVQ